MNGAVTKQDIQNLESVLTQSFDSKIEELGRMIKGGFDQVHQEIAGLDHRLENVELRLDQAAYRFELVEPEHRVGALEQHTGLKK